MKIMKRIREHPKIWMVVILVIIILIVILLMLFLPEQFGNSQGSSQGGSQGSSQGGFQWEAQSYYEDGTETGREELISAEAAQSMIKKTNEDYDSGRITCDGFARFSGQYVEDGRDELVENVAAILVTNHSDQYLELCTLQYDVDGKTAIFVVTGLPAGRSAWVMEKTGLVIGSDAEFSYEGCSTAFREDISASPDGITITSDGNMLTATNTSQETLENVCVYYKVRHDDGNFFGGITYMKVFGTLEPGQSVEGIAGHFDEEKAEIIRISWTDSNE